MNCVPRLPGLRVAAGLARRPGADVVRQLDRIELEAERLDTLIGQMLQVSQLRAVELALPREPLDLTSLLSDIVEDARLEASAANKAVEWTPGESVFVEGDHGPHAQRGRERAAQRRPLHEGNVRRRRAHRDASVARRSSSSRTAARVCRTVSSSGSSIRSTVSLNRATAIPAGPASVLRSPAHRAPVRRRRACIEYHGRRSARRNPSSGG